MRRLAVVAAVLVVGGGVAVGLFGSEDAAPPPTLAVYGDAPYAQHAGDTAQLDATPTFIDGIDADPRIATVVHLGDIHSGEEPCSESYDRSIADLWARFVYPLVYTPGDNEWSDCPAVPTGYLRGDPLANLELVREIFFPRPGETLGDTMTVTSQATAYDRAHPGDAAYVENVRWESHGVVFVTLNLPGGSNNDLDPWYDAPRMTPVQAAEVTARTGADVRWLDAAFGYARERGASAVVIFEQADMWVPVGPLRSHLAGYDPIVSGIAAHTREFGKPVLLLNGDGHVYRSDNPLSPGAPCETEAPGGAVQPCPTDAASDHDVGYAVPNFHRITVHGATFPFEWVELTVHDGEMPPGPDAFGPFTWQRVLIR